jgi:hypothetical protein
LLLLLLLFLLLLTRLVRWDVQPFAEGLDKHLGAERGEQVVQLGRGAVGGDARVRGLEQRDAVVEGVGGEGLDGYAGVRAPDEERVMDWSGAAEAFSDCVLDVV